MVDWLQPKFLLPLSYLSCFLTILVGVWQTTNLVQFYYKLKYSFWEEAEASMPSKELSTQFCDNVIRDKDEF